MNQFKLKRLRKLKDDFDKICKISVSKSLSAFEKHQCAFRSNYLFGVEQVSHHVSSQTRVVSGDHLSLQLHQQPFRRTAAIHTASTGADTGSINYKYL